MLKKAPKKYKCPRCGELGCFDHCALCGIDIIWRPRLLDREIKYTGIKPLRADNEQPHNFDICQGQHTTAYRYSEDLHRFLMGYPKWYHDHMLRIKELKHPPPCDLKDCPCQWVESLKIK